MFYGVRYGKVPGIYTTWDECKEQVIGVQGSIYKKFNTRKEAEVFIKDKSTQYEINENKTKKNSTKKKKKKTYVKEPNTLYIFTDGSSVGNGTKTSGAGYGIYIAEPEELKVKIYKKLKNGSTNNKAELRAILDSLKIHDIETIKKYRENIVIVTDSHYAIDCITKWAEGWKKNNWINSSNEEVKNKLLIKSIYKRYKKYNFSFLHINSHTNYKGFFYDGNRIVDKLASGEDI